MVFHISAQNGSRRFVFAQRTGSLGRPSTPFLRPSVLRTHALNGRRHFHFALGPRMSLGGRRSSDGREQKSARPPRLATNQRLFAGESCRALGLSAATSLFRAELELKLRLCSADAAAARIETFRRWRRRAATLTEPLFSSVVRGAREPSEKRMPELQSSAASGHN